MDKKNNNSTFDFDNDSDFNENFYKNIEKALGDSISVTEESNEGITIKAQEKTDEIIKTTSRKEDEAEAFNEESAAAKFQLTGNTGIEEIDEELTIINASLAKQITDEMDSLTNEKNKAKKKKYFFRIQNGVLLTLLCLVGFGFFFGCTKPGNQFLLDIGVNLSGTLWGGMTKGFDDGTDAAVDVDHLEEEDLNSDAPEVDTSTIVWPDVPGEGRQEEGVYNILILGEEAIGMGASRGRTDVIVIATMNTNDQSLKLTSLMRDSLVQIPGYKENKLNTAYEKGGLDLLYETIALNFDIKLDGCVMVNFENFEKIVDELGGLEITLTAGEANYLNSTNYISLPEYRNVIEGTQILNGNQALGYARVRKRSTITGNNNDYGRTDRHRIVLNAIFEKCKTKNKADLASLMFEFLPMITTDIDSDCFQMLLNSYIDMGMSSTEIQQLRIPADGTFQDNARVRGMSVLIPNYTENIEILHSFIFGDDTINTGATTNTISETGTVTTNPSN